MFPTPLLVHWAHNMGQRSQKGRTVFFVYLFVLFCLCRTTCWAIAKLSQLVADQLWWLSLRICDCCFPESTPTLDSLPDVHYFHLHSNLLVGLEVVKQLACFFHVGQPS